MGLSFTVKEMSELTGFSVSTLHYYEHQGLLKAVARNASGHRCYSEGDLEWLEFVKRLRATGMPLTQIRKMGDLRRRGPDTLAKRIEMVEAHERSICARIADLEDNLREIQAKLVHLREIGT